MAKKNWIYIKRGLSEDPKHRAAMGECIWLYMHIIDRADWETGIAYDWRDKEEAADMGMELRTLRDQRQKLEKLDYVRCQQKQHGQDIRIMEWKNPRDYGAETKNPRIQGDIVVSPSDFQGDTQGNTHGNTQVSTPSVTPSLDSKSKSSSSSDGPIFEALSNLSGGGLNSNTPKFVDAWLESHAPGRILQAIAVAKENKARSVKYVDEVLITWEANGYPKTRDERVKERKAEPVSLGVTRPFPEFDEHGRLVS